MLSIGLGGDAARRRELGVPVNQWHREDARLDRSTEVTQDLESGNVQDDSDSAGNGEGTWGERDVGRIDEQEALEELEVLRHNISRLQGTRTKESQASRHFDLTKVGSHRGEAVDALSRHDSTQAQDELEDKEKIVTEEAEEFELGQFMRDGHFEKRTEDGSAKRVGVIYKNLTVKGVESTSSFVRTLPDAILGTFGPDLYHILTRFFPVLRFGRKQPMRTLINDFTGCVRDGEMMLVLGRPGSGCSTFLKAASNNVESFAAVEGEISYGGIPAKKQKQMYRGEVNYNPEDDVHFASLNVWQTFTFALMNKTKKGAKEEIPIIADALLKMFGISHTKYTLVGDDYTRGVSGGERKRVSIAETLASKSTVMAWDNSTRGLDASTALDYAKSLRIMTDISNRTTLVTLYQAGEGIYELMDKVLVIDQGRQIFSGPAKDAKQYFIDLGFECPERQTTADFLTAVTDPNERRFEKPALFVRGTRSTYVPDEVIPLIGQFFPRFSLVDIDAGHWVTSEKPEEFLREAD
ncbi:hypothetical protein PC116_g27891 [Phytophthora cactorum]|nr:hypothetical protein PC116_g27891 [Phytophthora cactorum]